MFNLKKLYNKLILKRTVKKKMLEIEMALPEKFRAGFRQNFYLAGGAIRNMLIGKKVNDWDIFCKYKGVVLHDFLSALGSFYGHPGMIIQFKSENAVSLLLNGNKVQFIGNKYAGDPDEVVGKFDFTNSMCYYDISEDSACMKKELVFNDQAFSPKLSPKRAQKFIRDDWEYSDSFDWTEFILCTGYSKRAVENTNFSPKRKFDLTPNKDTTEDYE